MTGGWPGDGGSSAGAGTAGGLRLTAVLHPSALDARRGVVRLHPQVMAALGAAPWDPLLQRGRRTTAALAAYAPDGADRATLLCDDLVLGNLGLGSGTPVLVSRAAAVPAAAVSVSGPAEVMAAVDPSMLRFALLGKVVTAGDVVSLLPQDLSLPPDAPTGQLDAARRSLAQRVGTGWTSVLLTAVATSPAAPGVVTMGTVVGWQGGTTTTGSATPSATSASAAPVTVTDLPGLEAQAAALTEWLDVGFHGLDLLRQLGTSPRMGVLLSGPAGSGKGDLVRAVTAAVGGALLALWAPTLGALDPAAAVARLRSTLDEAARTAPSVVLIEDVEAVAPGTSRAHCCLRCSTPSVMPSPLAGSRSSARPADRRRSARSCAGPACSSTSSPYRCLIADSAAGCSTWSPGRCRWTLMSRSTTSPPAHRGSCAPT